MPWLITFIISWVILIIFFNRDKKIIGVAGGVGAVIFQLITDAIFINGGYYDIKNSYIKLAGSDIFFTLGIAFTMGALFAQYLPRRRWQQALNIFVFSLLFLFEESLLVLFGALEYSSWNHITSFYINILVFASLSWLVESIKTALKGGWAV